MNVAKLAEETIEGPAEPTLAFSIPKNLSLPLSRIGPISWSLFSNGDIVGAGGSFFAGVVPGVGDVEL